jgi:hypothetical protein
MVKLQKTVPGKSISHRKQLSEQKLEIRRAKVVFLWIKNFRGNIVETLIGPRIAPALGLSRILMFFGFWVWMVTIIKAPLGI